MAPPFRAEHMGSLLRPQALLTVREAVRDGKTAEEVGFDETEKKAVADVVNLQRQLGFRALGDGEFVRTRFWGLMWDEFDGTIRLQDAEASMFRLYHPDVVSLIEQDRKVMPGDSVIAGSKLRHNPSKSLSNLHELRLIQAALPKESWADIKLTMITPAWFHMRYKQGKAYTPEAYSNDGEYFADVAKVYQEELAQLYDAGLRNVQFDDPGLAYFCSNKFRDGWAEDKDNIGTVDDLLDAYIKLYNDSISKTPADMHTGVHLCRGNFIGGRHFAEGAYDIIAKKLFQELDVNTFYLEYDTARSGGFEPLKFLPANKFVVVGAISTKLRELEDKEEVKGRIMQAANFVAEGRGQTVEEALKSIAISPQCGFSTHESGYPLSEEDQRNKLSLVRQIADEIWGEP
ncbi:5-methyltetrahydropteroyltriglutamate-homocysteine methyltransferase [Ophiostoma piceae UAMH 11346]|uniref:5-methyltetrahydropteroyltriglutamate-homocysteine methyltransferase n=1 Tax=Ophiostoma piceae (strain UAMH 11346) TaxID=1262450 RepID=S3C9I2_OPHP1|nr:5-methyltetrahydropteroyltriglutamate-homocysteine methyltransferase [Ophiostoma piceae UAMH 11346]